MLESAESEIDVEALKARIRDAVKQRELSGEPSFITASMDLYKLLSENGSASHSSLAELLVTDILGREHKETSLSLQPTFVPREDNHYQLEELLQYHDHHFIWNAYRALLKREPDQEGYRSYLARLRSGERNKIDILASLNSSPEGRRANVQVDGLQIRAGLRRLYFLPVIGYLAELVVSVVRLPKLLRYQRQMENHLIAQQETLAHDVGLRLTDYQSNNLEKLRQVADSFAGSLMNAKVELRKQQQEVAQLQQQQLSTVVRQQQRTIADNRIVAPNGRKQGSDQRWHEFYADFADHFRSDSETVKSELRPYLAILKESEITSGILDVGCGRGEWLELLEDAGLDATGIESNSVLAAAVRNKHLKVIEADALEYLRGIAHESVNAVTAFHLVEHLEFSQLVELLDETRRILRPGGLLILETPNPKNLVVGACNFYSDPSHRQPLFPETLQFLLERLGFNRVRIDYLHPATGSPFKNDQPGSKELDTWLFGARDFAAFAWKD